MCLYLPDRKAANESELVALALGLEEFEVRGLLHLGIPVDEILLAQISSATLIPLEKLTPSKDCPCDLFIRK
jgi:hypothetical protein